MTTDPIALLRDAENYLSALHGSVARHDHLAANLACAGCELRDRIAAALPELAAVSSAVVAPRTDQAAAEAALAAVETALGDTLAADAREEALAGIAAVLPAPADQAAVRAAALREAADRYATLTDQNEAYDREQGELDETDRLQHDTVRDVVAGLRRLADQTQPEPGARHVHITIHHPDPTTATTAALCIADLVRGEYGDSHRLTITTDAGARQDGRPATAYGDGKGRVYCIRCAPAVGADVPLTGTDVAPYELCPSCGRHAVDVAAAGARQDGARP